MTGLIYVALGGAIGASARHALGGAMTHVSARTGLPAGTFTANVLGGFLMGLLAGWLAFKISGGENLRLFLGVGVLGGFTTFSSFSLEAVLMFKEKHYGALLAYVGGSVLMSIAALMAGLIIARKVFAP